MILATRVRLFTASAAVAAMVAFAPAKAQEISETHLSAARAAISAINATGDFDSVLPQAAGALKSELIRKNPDLVQLINATVDEKAIELASRRVDLEREAAQAYARVFSEQELKDIAAFYDSPTGRKLIADGPIVTREVLKAGEIWRRGIARDLAQMVGEQIQAAAEATGAGAAPAEGAPANQ
ncbi:DUF2059 domain-containing protein [Nitratireductor pacificus]|uniref:DUF2059 domain-containing protein n=1 Tax=Nitratireductor pacificus pht-3B TaxID=391937 RepID=K2MA98_9HYPH|nr:DUF2059 domain-containing protein [Nitratireductor pacificus]EKF17930.1 hypothetical protein NA2_15729 [Nitratireductor pacificus pht-3B]